MESKYVAAFKSLEKQKNDIGFKLNGGRILVELLPKKEITTASGLVLSSPDTFKGTSDSNRALLGMVLLTGDGYIDSDNNSIPIDLKIGSVVVLNEFGVKAYSQFPGVKDYTRNTIVMTSESEVQMTFDSIEEFEKYEKALATENML